MGYFDGMARALFKKDESGSTVFYPWGVFGKGRLLPDEAAENRVFRFVKLYYQISLVMLVGLGAIFDFWYYFAVLVPILFIWYYLQCKTLVLTYPQSHSKLTIKQANIGAATGFGDLLLWAVLIGSALFVVAALWVTVSSRSFDQRAIGFLGVLFFGACAGKTLYMLKVKP